MIKKNNTIQIIHNIVNRNTEINKARREYPDLEIGQAYKKWKEDRGEKADTLLSGRDSKIKKEITETIQQLRQRPCTKENCQGTQTLESICSGCVESRAGYKTKWTCNTCFHRDLFKEDINTWLIKLSGSQNT